MAFARATGVAQQRAAEEDFIRVHPGSIRLVAVQRL
jgi:hypothetical protein